MECAEEVVYQVVTPGEPEENGRCCLNGVDVDSLSAAVVQGGLEAGGRVLAGGSPID